MEEKLNIQSQNEEDYTLITLEGRIDGYWSKQLDEYLDDTLRAGNHNLALDVNRVNYLSSLGIRILIKHAKLFRQINGSFGLIRTSENISNLLKMAGLEAILKYQSYKTVQKEEEKTEILQSEGFIFEINPLHSKKSVSVTLHGNPEKLNSTGYIEQDCRSVEFQRGKNGIGLGALGSGFDDCKTRFGEYLGMGDVVVYLPSGKSASPDYMIRTGSMVPEIKTLYGITFEGDFDVQFRFSSNDTGKSLIFSQLISDAFKISGFDKLVMVALAETESMVGISLNHSPVADNLENQPIFSFPAIRDHVNFTTEPAFQKMLSLTVGIASKIPDPDLSGFTRPLSPDNTIQYHFHSAIFSYHPVKKTQIDLDETVNTLIEQDKVLSVIHLINDSRGLTGIGESEFRSGFCRIGKINSITKSS